MSVKEDIAAKLKSAMLARDEFLTGVLRDLKSAILNEEIKQIKRDEGLSDEEIEKVIARQVKQRDDSIEIYTAAGDKARAEKELAEREVLAKFLPEPLSEDELRQIAERVISTGGFSIKDMGRAIGDIKKEVGTRGDGALIAKIVKELLN
ncbi:MAG: GatB/YqeY domain-containing protein [Candidatus Nomurabacteria bacterium]|jgi:uncharacterized protein YqeY|nr:GatB/YqeY domain-containing protein [Candidatus Nomurabacteria bacterium]